MQALRQDRPDVYEKGAELWHCAGNLDAVADHVSFSETTRRQP